MDGSFRFACTSRWRKALSLLIHQNLFVFRLQSIEQTTRDAAQPFRSLHVLPHAPRRRGAPPSRRDDQTKQRGHTNWRGENSIKRHTKVKADTVTNSTTPTGIGRMIQAAYKLPLRNAYCVAAPVSVVAVVVVWMRPLVPGERALKDDVPPPSSTQVPSMR